MSVAFPQKIKNIITISSSIPTFQRIKSRISKRSLHSHIHSSIIPCRWDAGTAHTPSDGWWRNRTRHMQTLEYHPIWRRQEIVPPTLSWMNLKDSRVSERSQSQRDKSYMIPCTWGLSSSQIHRGRSGLVVARVWEEGEMSSCCLMGTEFQFFKMEKFWKSIA